MGTIVLDEVEELTTIKISELPSLGLADSDAVLPIVSSENTYNITKDNLTTFGNETNYTKFDENGIIRFYGNARPVNFSVVDSRRCFSSHNMPLQLTSLAVTNGMSVSGLDDTPGLSRRIEITGIDGGVHVKGRLTNAYTQKDTTHTSTIIKITLNTTNAVWEQSGEWHLILDILGGDITGLFTIHMPAFSITEYSRLDFYVTTDGATYANLTSTGFDISVAGPHAAEELFLNDENAGLSKVVDVSSTTGFYPGNEVFVSDSENSEWTRISAIVTDTSITVDLTNSYTTANGAQFDIFNYIKTPSIEPIQRGLFRTRIFKTGKNSGIQGQIAVPQQTDPTANFNVVLQYISTVDNPGSAMVSKWRFQYFFKTLGEDIPQSIQYAELAYADIAPPVSKSNYIGAIVSIPPEKHLGKNLMAFQLARLGNDGDTYTGDIRMAGLVGEMLWNRLGYEA